MKMMKILALVALTVSLMLDSIHAGEMPMAANADTLSNYKMDSWGNDAPDLEIKLPGKWEYEKHKGPDFDVHWFVAPDGSGSIGIYVGHHPNMRKADTAQSSMHPVGDKENEFFSEKRNELVFTQGIVTGFFEGHKESGISKLLLHIMINENKMDFTRKALEALETLKTKK